MDALSVAYPLLKSHEVVDLLIIMLGTNDVKERFNANAACIGARNAAPYRFGNRILRYLSPYAPHGLRVHS